MSRHKDSVPSTARFPQEYWTIVELVGEQERTLRLPFKAKNEAHNFRQRFYKFRNVAVAELPKQLEGFDNPKIMALDAIYITIEEPTFELDHPNTWFVVIAPRSTTPDACVIRSAIEQLLKEEDSSNATPKS